MTGMEKFEINDLVLETPRLRLRRFCQEDLADLYAYASTPGVGEMAGWKHHESLEETRRVLTDFICKNEVFALQERESGRVIGSLGVHVCQEPLPPGLSAGQVREIGYVLAKPYWGQGLMPQAVGVVVDYLFTKTDLQALLCGHFDFNRQSRRVIEKCGFVFWQTYRYDARQIGKILDGRVYLLTRQAYFG